MPLPPLRSFSISRAIPAHLLLLIHSLPLVRSYLFTRIFVITLFYYFSSILRIVQNAGHYARHGPPTHVLEPS